MELCGCSWRTKSLHSAINLLLFEVVQSVDLVGVALDG